MEFFFFFPSFPFPGPRGALPRGDEGGIVLTMTRLILPLLHDNHNHVSLYAALSSCPDVSGMDAPAARIFLESLPPDRLTVVRGWRTNALPLGPRDLERLPPLLLVNFSLHGFAVSDSGLPYLEAAAPELSRRRDDRAWCDANVTALFAAYCDLAGLTESRLAERLDYLLPLGMGSADDMAVASAAALDAVRGPGYAERIPAWVAPSLFRRLDGERRKACAGLKIFLDGALGSRSAAIAGPWIGPGEALFTYKDAELLQLLEEVSAWGKPPAVHAIGELAIDQVLRVLEDLSRGGVRFPRIRLEHVQLITREQAFRARDLGVVLSMQPNFSSDSRDYRDRLPGSYLEANNPFRMLLDQAGFEPGKDLLFGSDGMPDGIAYAARESLFPDYPGQALTIEELAAGYGPARGIEGKIDLEVDEAARRVAVAGVSAGV